MKQIYIDMAFVGIALTLVGLTILCGCMAIKSQSENLKTRREYVSWTAFCATHGYNANHPTSEVIDEYLDAWCGSIEEESAFLNAGVEIN